MVPVSPVGGAETIMHARETTVEPAAMKSATAVETPASAPAMRRRVGEAWLAERSSAQQSSCGAPQSPSSPGLGIYS